MQQWPVAGIKLPTARSRIWQKSRDIKEDDEQKPKWRPDNNNRKPTNADSRIGFIVVVGGGGGGSGSLEQQPRQRRAQCRPFFVYLKATRRGKFFSKKDKVHP